MDLVQLERFVAVADAGSLRKAAQRLGLSQPTLTWSIRHLEASVHGTLFERHGRGSRLTDAGQVLLPHAQRLLNEGRRAVAAVEMLHGARDPEISIAAGPPFTVNLVPRAIDGLLRAMPTLRIHLFQADGPDLMDRLRNGEFDVLVHNPRSGLDLKGIDFEKVYEERYALAARAGHPIFRAKGAIGLEDVAKYGWAIFHNTMTMTAADSPFGRAGLPMPTVRAQVTSQHLIRPLILSTDLLGYVARDLVAQELRDGTVRVIDLPEISMTTSAGLLVRKDATYTPAMKRFCREVRQVCRTMKTGRVA